MTRATFKERERNGEVPLTRYIARSVALKTRAFGTGAAFRVPQDIPLEVRSRPRQGGLDDGDQDWRE